MGRHRILFICIGNMCRSPMAEAMARKLGGQHVEAYSAGLSPAGLVADNTITTLEELGYPTEGLSSKGLEDVPLEEMDVIVSLTGPSGLYLLPRTLAAELESWSIPDPVGEDEGAYYMAARLIERRLRSLLERLSAPLGLA